MIEIKNIEKSFGGIKAVDNVSAVIEEGHVFGLIGTNGAGKSTLLRLACGVLKADSGSVTVDGEEVYDNPAAKAKLFYISDEQYFYKNGTPRDKHLLQGHEEAAFRDMRRVCGNKVSGLRRDL